MMKVGENGKQLIRDVEKLGPKYNYATHTGRIVAYLCPAKKPTIGYGHTKNVLRTDVGVREISLEQAEGYLSSDCEASERYINSLKIPNLNANQFDALVSLVHNVGSFGSTLRTQLVAGNFRGACATMKRYIHSVPGSEPCDGRCGNRSCKLRIEPGLITRRATEVALFNKPVAAKGVVVLPLVPLILGLATWLGTKAVPAIWQHHITQPTRTQIELSKDLCANHGDCSREKEWAGPSIEETPTRETK